MFVWARGFCGTRISCPASVDYSGTVRKIHMRKIRQVQGVARTCYHDGFHDVGTFGVARGHFRAQGCALTSNVSKFHAVFG